MPGKMGLFGRWHVQLFFLFLIDFRKLNFIHVVMYGCSHCN